MEDFLARRGFFLNRSSNSVRRGFGKAVFDLEMGRYETGVDPYIDVVTLQNTVLSNQQTAVPACRSSR